MSNLFKQQLQQSQAEIERLKAQVTELKTALDETNDARAQLAVALEATTDAYLKQVDELVSVTTMKKEAEMALQRRADGIDAAEELIRRALAHLDFRIGVNTPEDYIRQQVVQDTCMSEEVNG